MLNRKYLSGLRLDFVDRSWPREISGVTMGRSTRYLCSYEDGKKHKPRIFELLKQYGQSEDKGTWDLHHIVEGQHYADIDFRGDLARIYKKELPCVLIANEEHHALNSLLHCKESDELWRDTGLPKELEDRSKAAAKAAKDPDQIPELRERIARLAEFYTHAYTGKPVLQKIASNVFNDAKARLG